MYSLRGNCESYPMNEEAPRTDEAYQHSPTTVGVRKKKYVTHHVKRPRGLLWEAGEDSFSYDLAPQTANNWKKMS